MLRLVVARLGTAVGRDDAVHDALSVRGFLPEAAAPRRHAHAVGRHFPKRLVRPVPQRAAADARGALDGVLVVHEVAAVVVEVVGVLVDVERVAELAVFRLMVEAGLAGGAVAHPLDARVLARPHVRDPVVALVLYGAYRVVFLQPVGARLEVVAGTALVAEAPDHHAGVVLVALVHRAHAVDVCGLPLLRVREGVLAVVVAMRLDVRLVHHVDAVLVAEIVEITALREVAVADVVEVAFLEKTDVLLKAGVWHVVSVEGIRLAAVHALELDGLSVEDVGPVTLVGGVADRRFAETELETGRLGHAPPVLE